MSEPKDHAATPRNKLTLADIEAEIASEHYFTAANGVAGAGGLCLPCPMTLNLLTFCVVVLHNGHKEVGINHGPVDPANFDAEEGRKYARQAAIAKLWEPLGFRLRDKLAAGFATAGGSR